MDLASGKEHVRHGGHVAGVNGLAASPDGKTLYSAGDSSVRAWNVATAKEDFRFPGHEHLAASLALSLDGKTIASGGGPHYLAPEAQPVLLWEVSSRKEIHRIPNKEMIRTLAFSPDGQSLIMGGYNGGLRLWNVTAGREIRRSDTRDYTTQVLMTPDGNRFASLWSRSLTLWDAASNRALWSRSVNTFFPNCAAFSPDGQWLAMFERDKHVRVLETFSGKEVVKIPVDETWGGVVTFAADGRTLAFGGSRDDFNIRLWDLALGVERQALKGHRGGITCLAFMPRENLLASGSEDTSILLWDLTKVPPLKNAKPIAAKELQSLWTDLGNLDAAKAHPAIWGMVLTPAQALPFLKENLRPALFSTSKEIEQWVIDLSSPMFNVRKKATAALSKQSIFAEPYLTRCLTQDTELEQKRRLESLLTDLRDKPPPAEILRVVRAVQVLERIGTRDALQILDSLALKAVPEFSAARDRLAKRLQEIADK